MHQLAQLYGSDARVQEFVNGLNSHLPKEYNRSKTSFDSIFYYQVCKNASGKHFFFFNTEEEARDFYHDLKMINSEIPFALLEPSFVIKNKLFEKPKHKASHRNIAIDAILNQEEGIIISYPEALVEKVIVSDSADFKRKIHVGDKIKLQDWIDFLDHIGYERTNYVYEYGQFAIRGNIIDIYSYSYENPIRVELFDVDVEEIREFDIETQLSINPRQEVVISPSPSLLHRNKSVEKKYLLDFIDTNIKNNFIWAEESLDKKIQQEIKSIEALNLSDDEMDDFISAKDAKKQRLSKGIILCDSVSLRDISATPIIHKNFNKLHHSIIDLNNDGYKVYIQSEDEKQEERYRAIFIDLGQEVQFKNIAHEFSKGFIDREKKIAVFTTHEIFSRRKREVQATQTNISAQAQLIKAMKELVPGDYVTHIDHGVGRFSGLEKLEIGGHTQEAVRLIYANNDILYVHINSLYKISKYVGKDGTEPKMHRIGSDTWENTKRKTKKKIKDIAEDLIKLYAKRKASKGFAFSPDSYLQFELESNFEYEDTPDQAKATADIKMDMEREIPMDRLICGDVGFGKTELAIRAAFKAVADSKQVAVLVPTTLLAFQHYNTFVRRMEGLPCNIEFVNRFKTAKEKTDILKRLEEGKVDILIGTHALIGKNVKFKDLGLLIIDEEQKFGVQVKEKLKEFKLNVDTLTLTATPIPRTLQFSLLGARDYSLIQTPPPNRQSVYTEVTALDPEYIKEIINNEVSRGGQVFFVHNRVKDLHQMKDMLQTILPNIDIAFAHGQLEGDIIEKTLIDFVDKKYDVLLSTNIIESGIDIANANTMIINNAQNFGLSDLHQLRGRVGRSDKKAYCYLLTPPYSTLTNEAKQRLNAMEHNAELGSGFQIAMRDLDLRGAGNMLGGEQSGFISDIGYDTFMKILDEAITELKEGDYKELYQDESALKTSRKFNEEGNEIKNNDPTFEKLDEYKKDYVKECQIETDYDMYIPDKYISGSQERMNVYVEINQIKSEVELIKYLSKLKDVYGKLPIQIKDICDAIRLKWIATKLGIERINIKNGKMKCYLIQNQESSFYQSDTFGKMIHYINEYPVGTSMKQTSQFIILEFSTFKNCIEAKDKLSHILQSK
jgi:transcription-repair coupling factor (superfamily II helicase)